MISRDLVGGVASIVIGAVYLYFAYQLRASALDDSLGPAGMPRIYGWLLVALGVMLAGQAIFARVARAARAGVPATDEWKGQGRKIAWAGGLVAIGAGYLFLVPRLGYLLSVALLTFATAGFLGARIGVRLAAIAAGGGLVLWALFVLILGVSMPSGILGMAGL